MTVSDDAMARAARPWSRGSGLGFALRLFLMSLGCLFVSLSSGHAAELRFSSPAALNTNAGDSDTDDLWPSAATDGQGNWVAVWTRANATGIGHSNELGITVSRSSDNGVTWSNPALVAPDEETARFGYVTTISTDRLGTWLAVWVRNRQVVIARSLSNGSSWSVVGSLTGEYAAEQQALYYLSCFTDNAGHWYVFWGVPAPASFGAEDPPTFVELLMARSEDDGASWSSPIALSTNGPISLPRVAIDERGHVIGVWAVVGEEPEIVMTHSADHGVTWSIPSAFYLSSGSERLWPQDPDIATDGEGNWMLVWSSRDFGQGVFTDNEILVALSGDDGVTWSTPVALQNDAGSDGDDLRPRVVSHGNGDWTVLWEWDANRFLYGDPVRFRAAHSLDGGHRWTDPVTLPSGADDGMLLPGAWQLTTDGTGTLVLSSSLAAPDTDFSSPYGMVGVNPFVIRSGDLGQTWEGPTSLFGESRELFDIANRLQVLGDGRGAWLAVGYSTGTFDRTLGADFDIVAARSMDGGATWGEAFALNSNAEEFDTWDGDPRIYSDRSGTWLATWESQDPDAYGYYGDLRVSTSTDGGATWSAPGPLNANAREDLADDREVSVATDGAGTWLAAWVSRSSWASYDFEERYQSNLMIAESTNNGRSWAAPVTLNTGSASGQWTKKSPHFATDERGTWVLVWVSKDESDGAAGDDWDIVTARSTNAGTSWSTPTAVWASEEDESSPRIAVGGSGAWVLVWARGPSFRRDTVAARSEDNGRTWSTPTVLNAREVFPYATNEDPDIATDAQGNWVVVWTADDPPGNSDREIASAQSSDDGRTWSPQTYVNARANSTEDDDYDDDMDARVATDRVGTWVAVWSSYDTLGGTVGDDLDILMATSEDNGLTWSGTSPLNDTASVDSNEYPDAAPDIATDGLGKWLAVWVSGDTLDDTIGTDSDILFAVAPDPDPPISCSSTGLAIPKSFPLDWTADLLLIVLVAISLVVLEKHGDRLRK